MAASSQDSTNSGGSWPWRMLSSPVTSAPICTKPEEYRRHDHEGTPSLQTPASIADAMPTVTEDLPIHLKNIKTPHSKISYPELAFSPTDIGIWEVLKGTPRTKVTEGKQKPSEGFKSWSSLFGGS